VAKILVVEDYQGLQKAYEETFKTQNYDVRLASNGADALKLATEERFDIILLDILIPQIDGFDFLQKYDVSKHPGTQILILSNLYTNDLVNKALGLGATNYLLKSDITPKRLIEIVQEVLARKEQKSNA
jgi:DNA-binding response OmpR family regulator